MKKLAVFILTLLLGSALCACQNQDQVDVQSTEKTVIPFCTHDGYGAGNSHSDIAAVLPNTEVLDGLAIEAGDVSEGADTVVQWLSEIGLEGSGDSAAEKQNETPIRITIGNETLEGVDMIFELAEETN